MMPSSPRFWTPRGTSFGFGERGPEERDQTAAQISASSIGLLKWKLPIVKSGVK